VVNDTVYMQHRNDDGPYYEPYSGELHLLAYDLNALRRGEPFIGVDLLADIPQDPVSCVWQSELTQDGRYYIIADRVSLRVFDLRANAPAIQLSATMIGLPWDTYQYSTKDLRSLFAWRDGKLYWFPVKWNGQPGDLCQLDGKRMIEITLP
jgi:hypothetical protein